MSKTYDVAVIGGGHNGLTCARCVAKAGLKITLKENNGQINQNGRF